MANDLYLTASKFSSESFFSLPCPDLEPKVEDLDLFDQNGYDLTPIELAFAKLHGYHTMFHRPDKIAMKQLWFEQDSKYQHAIINHCNLFERKGYDGLAKQQLLKYTEQIPLIWKIIKIRPKWGLDFSIDYCDVRGNVFEILHWEWDSFSYNEIVDKKLFYQQKFLSIDWDDAALSILAHKDQWYNLDFYQQSDWKCNYFGVEKERFKMVCWS